MSSPPTARQWRGQSLADRSLVRRRQLVQAGYELLGVGGVADVTVRAVCRHAQLSPRYFYESFTDTDELIVTIYDECNSEIASAIAAAVPRADLAESVRAAIDAAVEYFETDIRRVRVLLREPLTSQLLATRRAAVAPAFLTSIMAAAGMTDLSPLGDAELAMSASALSGALVSLMLDYTDQRLAVTAAQVADYATRLVRATVLDLSLPKQTSDPHDIGYDE